MTTPAAAPTAPALVVVHCVDLKASALENRLAAVVATLPADVEVVATTALTHRSTTAVGGRVRLQRVDDQGYGLVERAVRAGRLVVTVPTSAAVAPGWYEAAARASRGSSAIGVLLCGQEGLFVFPAGVLSVTAPREEWPAVPGVTILREAGRSTRRRSLSAVLIVKDEEETLAECLAALEGVVDQVVVYDTGSSDRTVDIARGAGADVVLGHWDDDFGAARNRALLHATGAWVLSVDADEVVDCSAEELRQFIDATPATAAMVRQVSTSWTGAESGFEVRVVRLFRRDRGRWTGAIHEAVVPVDERAWSVSGVAAPLRLMHSGYRATTTEGRGKGDRNATIALTTRDSADVGSVDWVTAQSHYGRSLALAGRLEEARDELDRLLDHVVPAAVVVPAARVAIHLHLVDPQSWRRAAPWVERAEAAGEAVGQVALWRSRLASAGGDRASASRLLAAFGSLDSDGGADPWGQPYDVTQTVTALAEIDLAQGVPDTAFARMAAVMHAAPDRVSIPVLLGAATAAGLVLRDLVREAPSAFLERSLRDVPQAAPSAALAWFTAMADEHPGDYRPVVAASVAAARTGVTEALEWALRAREGGFRGVCALRLLAEDPALPAQARLLAWAVLLHGFGELDAGAGVMGLVDEVDEASRARALTDLRLVAPDAVDLLPSGSLR